MPVISDYMATGFDQTTRKTIVEKMVKRLKKVREFVPFDAIAFRGISGALFASTVADALEVSLIAVRKPGENCHSSCDVEGRTDVKYIIIDDFISSGETICEMVDTIKQNSWHYKSECVGYYMWHPGFIYCQRHEEKTNNLLCLNVKSPEDCKVVKLRKPGKKTRSMKI